MADIYRGIEVVDRYLPLKKMMSNSLFKVDVIIKCKKEEREEARRGKPDLV